MAPVHCRKLCVTKNVLTSSFTSTSVFGNFISCSPRKVVTAYETCLIIAEIYAHETPKPFAVLRYRPLPLM